MFDRIKWLVPTISLIIALILLSSSNRQYPHSSGKSWVLELVGPVESLLMAGSDRVSDFWGNYLYLVNVRKENKVLTDLIVRQETSLKDLGEYKIANERLNALLGLAEAYPHFEMQPAHVIAWDPGAWFRAVVIDLGSKDGIRLGQPVVHARGIVGRVVEVSLNYSRVLLATDFNSSIDCFVQRSRAVGILSGQNARPMSLKYVSKDEDVRIGDLLVSSGLEGYFPRGIPLGTVSRVNRQNADIFMEVEVSPQVPFDRLEEVMVVVNLGPPIDFLSLSPTLRPLLEDAVEAERQKLKAERLKQGE